MDGTRLAPIRRSARAPTGRHGTPRRGGRGPGHRRVPGGCRRPPPAARGAGWQGVHPVGRWLGPWRGRDRGKVRASSRCRGAAGR